MTIKQRQCVVTLAGSDSSGGAGIQADIKAISATGCYAASIITALTAQNTQGVQAIKEIPTDFVKQQIESVFNDLNIHAIKIGMLFQEGIIDAVASAIKKFQPRHVVLDPVVVSKSGCELLPSEIQDHLKIKLFPLATLITPNLFEAQKFLGVEINDTTEMEQAAMQLGSEFRTNILLKGGHLNTDNSSDVLYLFQDKTCFWFHAKRIKTMNTHGTGCTLSAAIASYLAQNYSLYEAISLAKKYLNNAIQAGSFLKLGHGFGPVDHFFILEKRNDFY